MKERSLYDDDFERQLKEKSDQFKMYPSDKVWNEVHSSLHTRRRRFVIGMTVLIGGILTLAGTQLISPAKNTTQTAIAKKTGSGKAAQVSKTNAFTSRGYASSSQTGNNLSTSPTDEASTAIQYPFKESFSGNKEVRVENPEYAVEMIPSVVNTKPVQQVDISSPQKSESLLSAKPSADNDQALVDITAAHTVTPELAPEKSPTQLTHLRNDRFSWEIYFTPTLNTHYLTGMNYQTMSPAFQGSPIMVVHYANVNGFVDNTPVLGYNVGGNILYKLSKNLSLKAGLEFSFNRYYIKTYNSYPGQAGTQVNSYLGYVADSLQNPLYGASIDKNPQHVQNRYYQLSVPVGLDLKVAGSGKIQLHIGGTIQPSYLLNTDAYVLSSDYMTYTKDPEAFRRWNLNVGGEVYISYAIGNIRWELGPQVRYQLFSTYKNSYPLRENMLNYGIRIGISKSIR